MSRLLAAVALALLAGCAGGPGGQQRLVWQPNMLFADESPFTYASRLLPQVEPGLAFTGGAQASTCSACR
ncbi:MAG TPA: hypothetical protein VNO52_14490 [Methylomirabilota bacterium]|nr:hypothetical protein [Methylomirabilota bacterium]